MDIASAIASAVGTSILVGGIASLYFRAQSSGLSTRMAVLEFRASETARQLDANYDYCHTTAHDTRDLVAGCDARLQLNVMDLAQRVAVAEFQLKAKT